MTTRRAGQLLLCAFLLCAAALGGSADARAQEPVDPLAHDHPAIRCFTPLLIESRRAPEKMAPSLLALLNELCAGPSEPTGRPIKQVNVLTSGGHFRVHYDTDGDGAVAPRDNNANGVPDYVDSVAYYLELAWRVEIDEMGYMPPPSDRRGPGPEIDVYICELPGTLYGGAWTENDNIVGTDPIRAHGYLVLDNDYAGYPTPGILGLRVTTAHEFHHIVEFSAYRTALSPFENVSQFSLYESTATWMEEKVHPEVDDWRQYAEELLSSPQKYGYSTHSTGDFTTGYAHILYLLYLERRFGEDVVREFWEEFRTRESFDAIDAVLRRHDFNLSRSYCEFAQVSYYTGFRARDTVLLKEAPTLPAMRAATTRLLDAEETSFEDELYPLSFGLYRLLVPGDNVNIRDTVDFLVTNGRSDIGAGGPTIAKEAFRIDVSRTSHAGYLTLRRDDGDIHYRLVPLGGGSADAFCLDVITDRINQIIATHTSPQPFMNLEGEDMLFAVEGASQEIQRVKVWIYTSSMSRVVEIEQQGLMPRDNQLGVVWNGKDRHGNRVPSGIYLYEMSVNGKPPVLGKFAVVRE